MNSQLFIPDKIKVGFQTRSDTYSKKLGYIIYQDKKAVWRKETSWEGWRDKKIEPEEFDNVPMEGFVLNRAGLRVSDWNSANSFIRIFDPRGFEFEISTTNLLFILMNTDCLKKGLEGEFVYSWAGKDLVLLPVGCEEYKLSKGFTNLQGDKVSARNLVAGRVYETKKQEKIVYLGKHEIRHKKVDRDKDCYYNSYPDFEWEYKKEFVFWYVEEQKWGGQMFSVKALVSIAREVSEDIVENYAELMENLRVWPNANKVLSLEIKPRETGEKGNFYVKNGDSYSSVAFLNDYDYNKMEYLNHGVSAEGIIPNLNFDKKVFSHPDSKRDTYGYSWYSRQHDKAIFKDDPENFEARVAALNLVQFFYKLECGTYKKV